MAVGSCEPPQNPRQADEQQPPERTSTRRGIAPSSKSSPRAAGAADPAQLAMRLALVVEGATTLAFLGDRDLVIEEAREMTRDLIQQSCPR